MTTHTPHKLDQYTTQGWLVVLAASLFFFYEFIQLNFFNAVDEELMQAFNLDASQLGQLSSMYFYGIVIFLFFAGILLDRLSPKKIILTACGFCIVGTYAFGVANSYSVAAIGRFIVGAGSAFCFLGCVRIASRWFPPRKMALVTGVVVTMAMLGGLVAQTPFALLSHAVGWRHAVLINAAFGLVILVIIALVVEDRPPGSQESAHAEKAHLQSLGFWRSIGLVLKNKYNWFGGIYTSLVNLPVFILGALFGIHYLVQVHHLTSIQASYATTLFFVGIIFGAPAFGWFSDYIGRRVFPMILGAVLSLIAILVLMYAPNLSLTSLILLFFIIGFVTSSQVLSYPTIAELNPPSLTSTATSIDSITIMLGGVIVQPLYGWLMELRWNHTVINGMQIYSAHDFMRANMIFPISFVISIFIAWLIKETYCESQVS